MTQKSLQGVLPPPLKERAERLLSALDEQTEVNKADVKALIHELQAHQVELEVQNEEVRQAQLTLADALDQYRELYDDAPVAYVTLDQQGMILKANLKASDLLDKTRKILIGSDLANYFLPASQNDYFLHLQQIFSSEKKLRVDLSVKTQPVKIVRMESISRDLATDGTRQSHTVLVDITSEKNLQQSLTAINQNLEQEIKQRTQEINTRKDELLAILDTATDAIITINDQGIIESANRASGPMFGYADDELIGSNVSRLMPAPHTHSHDAYISKYLQTGKSRILGRTTEMLGKRQDNTIFHVSLSVNRIDDSRRFTGVIRDATARIQLESEVLQASERERNRISRELHDSVSQSLVGITMQTDSLAGQMEKWERPMADRLTAIRQELEKTVKEVGGIVKNLAVLQLQDNSLQSYFLDLVTSLNSYTMVNITLDWEENLDIKDPHTGTQLYRIAQEALRNAIKHANAEEVAVTLFHQAETIIMTITDNGKSHYSETKRRPDPGRLTGQGISNMTYRAHVIGASLDVHFDQNGTTVRCVLSGQQYKV